MVVYWEVTPAFILRKIKNRSADIVNIFNGESKLV